MRRRVCCWGGALGRAGELECGEDGLVNLLGGPVADGSAAVQEHLQASDDPGVLDLDAGIPHRTDSDRQGQSLQQGKIRVHVEAFRLEAGKAVRDRLESFPHRVEMVESFFQTEIALVIGAEFIAQAAGELFILFEEGALPAGAENVMAMLDLVDDRGQFAAQALVQAEAEDLADPVGRQPPEADLAASLEDLVNGETAFEDEVPAVLDLSDGIESRQVHLAAFLFGKLRPQDLVADVEVVVG